MSLWFTSEVKQELTTELVASYIGHELNRPLVGRVYSVLSGVLVPTISVLFLRLYFLPASQSVPPFNPPDSVAAGSEIIECADAIYEELKVMKKRKKSYYDKSRNSSHEV